MITQYPCNVVEKMRVDGFLLIKVSKETTKILNEAFDAAFDFFRKPQQEKTRCSLPNDFGYRPIGVEYSQSPERPDPAESFTVGEETRELIANLPSMEGRTLCDRILSTTEIFEPIAEELTVQMANALGGQDCGDLLRGALGRWSCLQVNYSRPSDNTLPFIHESHEDGHLLTLARSTGPGLEVQTVDGNFLPITTALDEVLVMPGEIAWLLSGGQIRPVYHRVRNTRGELERGALLFFADIDPRLCKPWVSNDVNKDIDIGARMLNNPTRFGLGKVTLK